MIILISEVIGDRRDVCAGDSFQLTHSLVVEKNGMYVETIDTTVLCEEIVMDTYIDYYCIFVFADETGRVTGNNMCGLFGKQDDVPEEIKNAVRARDLTDEQKDVFVRTCPVRSDIMAEHAGPDTEITMT